jgi:hypothetical protein
VPATCSDSTPWGTPVLLAGVNGTTSNEAEGRLSPDELTIYFMSDRAGGTGSNDIYMSTRASISDNFGTPQAVAGVNTTASDAWPSVTADGLSMYLESNSTGTYQVMISHRTTVIGQFPAPTPVANVNVGVSQGQPYILPDESVLYFAANPTSTVAADLFRSARGPSGQFGAPVAVSTVNTQSTEYAPVVTSDELTIYFASTRTDSPAKGNFDIWKASRASTSASFDPPVNVQELNTANTEWPEWMSPDHCRLYFSRSVANQKLYVASRSPM